MKLKHAVAVLLCLLSASILLAAAVTMDGIEHLSELDAPVFSELPAYDFFEQ